MTQPMALLDFARQQREKAAEKASRHPWAAARLDMLARRYSGPAPTYGDPTWELLSDTDPRKYAALLIAAEQWRRQDRPRQVPTNTTGGGAYVRAALGGEVQHILDAVPGTRHKTVLLAAQRLGTLVGAGQLDEQLARTALTDAGDVIAVDQSYSPRNVRVDVRDGLAYGIAHPRPVAV